VIEVALVGRLGRDPEHRMVKGGELAMVSFSAAVEERQQAVDAPTTWIRVVVFGDLAEELAQRLKAGARCYMGRPAHPAEGLPG
jgi:single-stranded DNA-binding protein